VIWNLLTLKHLSMELLNNNGGIMANEFTIRLNEANKKLLNLQEHL